MAQTNVSNTVLSIVASFTSGLDIFRKFRDGRQKRKKSKAGKNDGGALQDSQEAVELRLARSLRQGPEDIGREYARSISAVGDGFAQGDGIAQTHLAEILLRLNSGLVGIINSFLEGKGRRGGKQDIQLDYGELTRLSEGSRMDTVRTLRGLVQRMMGPRLPVQMSRKGGNESNVGQARSRIAASPAKHTRVRGPMLARVVIADSAKPSRVALVRPGERKKKSRSSSSSDSSKAQSNVSLVPASQASLSQQPFRARPDPKPSQPTMHRRTDSAIDIRVSQPLPEQRQQPRRQQSALDVSKPSTRPTPQPLRTTQSTPRLEQTIYEQDPLAPMPNTAPLPSFEPRRRKPTPTYYSIETTSTKLGEIPLHKWAQPYDFDAMSRLNREAVENGWPLSDMHPTQVKKKKRLGLWRLFGRKKDEV